MPRPPLTGGEAIELGECLVSTDQEGAEGKHGQRRLRDAQRGNQATGHTQQRAVQKADATTHSHHP